jgi:RNA polymerase sigma-70 factor (ECF subfamily)
MAHTLIAPRAPLPLRTRRPVKQRAMLVASMRPALVAFFQRRCRNVAEAEDLAQDVVLRALTHADALTPAKASSYVFRIALNRWRDRGRRLMTRGVCVAWDDKAALQISDGFSPERVAQAEQELEHVICALQTLGERTRDVLVLCRIEQMKQSDIAREMGISVSAVEKHLVRAADHLARQS